MKTFIFLLNLYFEHCVGEVKSVGDSDLFGMDYTCRGELCNKANYIFSTKKIQITFWNFNFYLVSPQATVFRVAEQAQPLDRARELVAKISLFEE